MDRPGQVRTFDLSAGWLCLDFANTLSGRRRARPADHLQSYADLVAWARQAGALDAAEAALLLAAAIGQPDEAARVLERARRLREAVYRLCSTVAAGREVASTDLELLNAEIGRALAHARLKPGTDGLTWAWDGSAALDRPLWPVARSAAELLTGPERAAVRECAEPACGWLFLDTSRNRSRRWCDMRVCGNRAKARRHYARRKRGADGIPQPG